MKVQHIIDFFEEISPLTYAEGFDNVGLLTGTPTTDVGGILITLDTIEEVVEQAIEQNCNLIVSFHPIIFNGLKKLTGQTYVERAVIKAIQHNIAIYAIHTALDNSFWGVNARICDRLGINSRKILIPQNEPIRKLVTYIPENQADKLRNALFEAGAGSIGNYDQCSFNLNGTGTFRGNQQSNPTVGEKHTLHFEKETQIGVIFPKHLQNNILNVLFAHHPYEEVAYEIYTLANKHKHIGLGMIGNLPEAMSEIDFLKMVKHRMQTDCIRHSAFIGKKIRKVAVLGGSGAFAIGRALQAGADAFVTADVKYHEFFQSENQLLITDIGHYESEQFTKNLLFEKLTKKFPNFAPILISQSTNPIKYL